MPTEIEAHYRWNGPTLTEAYRWHRRQSVSSRARLLLVVALALLGWHGLRTYFRTEGGDTAWLWGGGVGVFYVVLLVLLRRYYVVNVMRRNLAKSPLNDSPMDWHISEDGLRYQYVHGRSEMTWGAFLKAVQTPTGLLLYPQPLMFHWLPRQSFTNEADFEQVAKWASVKVPNFRQVA